ncbi:MAG: CehA/McbA family metallohydrolase [Oscillospiraceae bacterium]|nr:CehA/McbA family metallohydrolase [Oscillospiraceae bacterium]
MNKRSTRWFALLLAVAMVFSILPTAVFAEGKTQTYTKVTAAPKDWSGTYLIVSEGDSLIMDGSRTNLDVEGNKVDVTITEGKITGDYAKYAFTIAPMEGGYSVQSASGKYISGTSGRNKLNSNASPALNAISFADGKVKIVSNTTTLQYNNAATNGTRFRYYKSENQQPISLYKLEAAPARQSGIIKAEDIQNGDKVVVFNPVYGKTLSTEYSGYYNKGTDVTLAEGKLTGYTDADIWTVGVNKDGTYTFSTGEGKKLSMGTGFTSTPLDDVNQSWKLNAVDGKEATYYIDNTGRTDKYRMQFQEKFGTWSAYTGTGDAFEQQLYLVVDSSTEPDPGPEPTPGALFKDGEQVVIYNPANMKALSTEYSGFYNKGTDVTLTNGTLTGYTDADIWTVGVNEDGTYTFSTSEGKKLSMDTGYTSTPLDKVNDAWNVTPAATENCFYIQNAVRGNYLEWYADKNNWSSYGKIGDEALFAQAFYRVRKSGIVTSLSAGDTVVVFNPANMKALSTEYSGFYNKGTDVTLADGKLSGYTKADIWTVGVNEDGTYTFSTSEGKKLSMDTGYTSTPLDKVNDAWNVTPAATENCFYIQNAVRGNYLEWYADKNNWSSYGKIGDEALFAQQFYLVVDDGSDQPSGDLPKPGDKFVIYNQNAQAVLAAENDTQSIEKAAAVIENGKAVPANGAVVFTVEQNGEYLRFYSEAYGYLCSNGTGNNAFYSKDFSEEGVTTDDADWLVRTCSGGVGGYEMESRVAKYSGHSQWLEYYSDAFKTYSMYNVTDYTIYSFFFYPVADGVNVDGGLVVQPTITFPETMLPAYVGSNYEFDLEIDTIYAIDDPWIEYSIRDEKGKLIGGVMGGTDVEVLDGFTTGKGRVHITVFDTDIEEAAKAGSKMTLTFAFKDVKGNEARASYTVNILDEPVISNVTPAQGAQTGTEKKPVISAEIANAGETPTVTMTVNNETVNASYADGKVTYTPAAALADGRVTVTVTVKRADGKEASKTWSFTIGEATFQRYFGQLHSHTQYSDGAGSLESALSYVKNLPDTANVDFVAFTDHSNYFDTTSAANPEGALYDMSLASASSQQTWKSYKDAVAAFNAENAGSMVAMAGFEMTWSGGPGHINTFNTPGIVSRNNSTLNNKTKDAGLQAYYKLLSQSEGANALSQFNHPGTTFGNFIDFGYWDAVIDTRMYMVEVGNGEGQIGAGGYYPSYEQYIMALDKGWHVAPTNNQDNHKGRWGNANDARDVVLTDDFTEDGIYEAIRNRRMYATEDKNLELDYTVNGNMMGSIIDVPEKLSFEVSFNDPDRTDSIAKVELVANSGKVAYTWDNAADLAKGSVSVTLDPEYTYYFVRVTEGDGDLAVTAPVWVGESLKLGISKAECGTSTPVTDEELTITTTFFNSEAKPATIKSITYTIGNETIGTVTDAIALAASSTQDVEFKYTPTKARVMTVKITAVIEQDGKDYTFTKDVTLDVLDAGKLVYIGIDASHYNEYVAGNYKDSMGNFGELAAGYSVRTVMLKTSEELIAACGNAKFKGLILTAPSRRLADAQTDPRTYSEAELNAIKAFNENGGMVVLAGWSDNYENYPVIQNNPAIKHMAATQNEVLAALGSSLRISDDATYDDVRSAADGVDKWRLYFSAYNMDNPLLKGVEFDAEHPFDKLYTERFSHYGGASIYAVDASGNPTPTMPATVSPVVYGHATTYSVDVDKDGLGGAATPKYTFAENDNRLMVMASEQLEGKGLIVVSGAAFMSNFEVQYQASDNGAEKNYSNYKICQNLLSMLNQTQIDKISDVQAEKDEGVKYTIEGIVTSNASGYDKDTAFFDCIYVQDNTAGINAFPVAGNFKIGDKVRITGTTSSYQGERHIAVTKIEKIADAEPPAPLDVTAAQVNDGSVLGTLVRVKGTITRVEEAEGKIQTIMVKDAAGNETRIFIDGYITKDKEVQNAVVGNQVEAVGLASYDNTFVLSDGTPVYPRIRIRDRDDVVCSKPDSKIWSVTLVTDGGTINSGNVTAYIEGVGAVLPTDVTRRNYIFLGWFTADNIRVTEISAADSGDKIFYAHWMAAGAIPGIIDAIGDSMRFDDVTKGDWFYKDVEYVYNEGIMDGVSKREFAPNETLTRAMIVKILYRIEGEPAGYRSSDFNDVESGRWYTGAVAWAAEKEIVKGYGNGKFGPNDPVTREQLAAILYRYTQYKGWSTTAASGSLKGFADAASISSYAVDAMNWAVDEGLLKGANNKLSPKSNATRAQVAAIIHRYLKG